MEAHQDVTVGDRNPQSLSRRERAVMHSASLMFPVDPSTLTAEQLDGFSTVTLNTVPAAGRGYRIYVGVARLRVRGQAPAARRSLHRPSPRSCRRAPYRRTTSSSRGSPDRPRQACGEEHDLVEATLVVVGLRGASLIVADDRGDVDAAREESLEPTR